MIKHIPTLDQCTLAAGDKNQEITVERLSSYLERNQDIVFPHRHDFYQIVLFTKGSGCHRIDFQQFSVEPWQIYFMTPAQIHTWEFEGDMEGYVVNFNTDVFQTFLLRTDYLQRFTFFSGLVADAVFFIPEEFQRMITDLMDRILLQHTDKEFTMVSLLYLFKLLEIQQKSVEIPEPSSYNYTLIRNFLTLVESNYKELRLPKAYAQLLYITPNHLNALSKEYLNLAAGEVIRNRVLLEAKRLLAIRAYSISEIAYELNFSDTSYFTKFFKKIEEITPEQFRMNYLK